MYNKCTSSLMLSVSYSSLLLSFFSFLFSFRIYNPDKGNCIFNGKLFSPLSSSSKVCSTHSAAMEASCCCFDLNNLDRTGKKVTKTPPKILMKQLFIIARLPSGVRITQDPVCVMTNLFHLWESVQIIE